MMIDRPGTFSQSWIGSDRFVDKTLGARHRVVQRQSLRQARGDRGGVRASGAVSVRRGTRAAGNSRHRAPSKSRSVASPSRWPPLMSTARAPISSRRQAAPRMSSNVRIFMPVSASASGTFGVTREARGSSSSRMAAAASEGSRLKPCLLTITGSTTSGNVKPSAACATASTISVEPRAPVLAAAGRNILQHGGQLCQHQRGRHHLHARHAHRILYRKQCDHGFAVDAELVEGFQVGLNPRAAARVASRDGEGDGRHPPSITRISHDVSTRGGRAGRGYETNDPAVATA